MIHDGFLYLNELAYLYERFFRVTLYMNLAWRVREEVLASRDVSSRGAMAPSPKIPIYFFPLNIWANPMSMQGKRKC